MTLHFPDQVETNVLTLDTWDPKSGTAEFKATAIRVEHASAQEIATAAERLTDGTEVDAPSGPAPDGEGAGDERGTGRGRRGPRPAAVRLGGRRRAPRSTRTPRSAATPPARVATCSSPCCTRCRKRPAGSARARSTTCASGSPFRRPRRTASRPSTPCSAPSRPQARWCTSATTWPARWPARRSCAPRWPAGSAARAQCSSRISGGAQRHRRHLAALPVPGPVRPRLGRADPAGGRGAATAGHRPGHPGRGLVGAHRRRAGGRGPPRGARPPAVPPPAIRHSIIPNGGGCPRSGSFITGPGGRKGLAAAPPRPRRPRFPRLVPGGGRLPDAAPRHRPGTARRDP